MNNTSLVSLDNLPNIPLERLEIADNKFNSENLKKLAVYQDSLQVLNIANSLVDVNFNDRNDQ